MRIKVVLDTNVFISAILIPGSNPDKIMQLVKCEFIHVIISPGILDELEQTLKNKLKYSAGKIRDVMIWIEHLVNVINPIHTVSMVCKTEIGHRILECALSGEAMFIISGDKNNLLCLKKYKNIDILSPAEFLETVLG
jgi:hypothetical protein